jgi:hypothetical protein
VKESILKTLDHISEDLDTRAMREDDFIAVVKKLTGKAPQVKPSQPPTTQHVFTAIKEVIDGQEISEELEDPASGNIGQDVVDPASIARKSQLQI